MNLTKFSIDKNRISLMILATIIILGLVSYTKLSQDSMPPYVVRVATVVTSFPGASPERVEQLITDKIEKTAQELPELKEVNSTSRTGLSVVSVQLKDEVAAKNMQTVWDRFRRKLNNVQLPQGAYLQLKDDGLGDVYGIVLGLTSDGYSYAEMKEYADDIKDDLIRLPDAAKVAVGGEQSERIFVEFDNTSLKKYGLTAGKLQQFITTTNILNSGGQINVENQLIIIEPTGNFNSIEDIKNTLITVGESSSQLVKLSDITQIKKGYIHPSEQQVRINGKNAISLHINLKKGANITLLGQDVDVITAQWQSKLPVGLDLVRVSSLDTYIDNKVSDFVVNLLQSVAIVLLVMLLFLGIRTGFVIASLIPIVTIMTLLIMNVLNLGLNQVTLAALIMALGMLVDNAIVVAETIMVKMEQGVERYKASIEAFSELWMPLLISTLTTSAAFLAFYLSPTNMGDMVGPIFLVISIALLSSWLIALSIITLFSYWFLKVAPKGKKKLSFVDKTINRLKAQYKNLILIALHHKAKVILGIFVVFLLSVFAFRFVPFVFFADSDRNMITIDINLPEATKIERTAELVSQLETFIKDSLKTDENRPVGIVDWSSYIGSGPESYDLGYSADEPNSNYAHILVNTSAFTANKTMIAKLDAFAFANFPDADIKVGELGGSGGGAPVEILIIGDNPDKLSTIAERVKLQLLQISGTKNIKDDWGPKSKKFLVKIDQNRAQKAGVSNQDIATSLTTVFDGFQTGEFRKDDKSIPIVLRANTDQEQSLASLEALNVFAQNTGQSVPLLQVADIVPQWQYSKIKRKDLKRTVRVTAELRADGNASEIMNQLTPWLEENAKTWGDGYTYDLGGEAKQSAEAMGSVISYLPISAFIIVLLLIIQFNSFRKTTIILLTIPLGIIGVVIGMLIFRTPFGFMPFLGVISLAGIIINNAIVLIDRMEVELNNGRSINDAVIAACLQRFRPILLATFTTVLGLIPLYISGGEMWEGMAVCIMVGLLFGTIITLVFVPAMFSMFYKVSYENYTFNEKLFEE